MIFRMCGRIDAVDEHRVDADTGFDGFDATAERM